MSVHYTKFETDSVDEGKDTTPGSPAMLAGSRQSLNFLIKLLKYT